MGYEEKWNHIDPYGERRPKAAEVLKTLPTLEGERNPTSNYSGRPFQGDMSLGGFFPCIRVTYMGHSGRCAILV
jgi:hypothetical protein